VRMSGRGLLIGAIAALTASVASANYHFVHYAGTGAPYTPIFERFPLESQPDGVVPYFIQEPPATLQFSQGDTFPSLVSQIRAAAEVWNSVGTSTFRFAFGGMATPNITMNTPAVLVSFDDELPPGIVAMGGPITRGDMVTPVNGQTFVPIIQSSLVIGVDMRSPSESSTGSGPSWSDRLFLTLVHELGHTTGLQHTWTSSVMSTEITRAMTKSHPLGQDDIAGISMLYPTSDWATSYGSITGQVMLGDQGVNLASVVALTAGGEAISTLTNPDGTYVLSGLPAGAYQVYVHPVPPSLPSELLQPVNLVLPVDGQGTIALSPAFNTIFQTGTASLGDPVQVTAGQATTDVNFSVTQRDSVSIYDVQTYSYFWNNAAQAYDTAKPATFLLGDNSGPYAVAAGNGLFATNGTDPAPGLTVSVLGAPDMMGAGAVKAYPYSQGYLEFDLSLGSQTVPGRRHLIFNLNGETEVLPSALLLSSTAPPSISNLLQNSDGTVTVSGSGLNVGTRILFDGVSAAVLQAQGGTVTVVPPPALPAASAAVIALSPSGLDSSSFAPAAAPPAYSYANNGAPAIQVTPNAVSAGSDAVLDLTGTNVNFAVAGLRLGFGTSDIAVHHIWLLSAQHAQVAISIAPTAVQGLTTLTLSAGLQLVENSLSFQITAPSQLPWVSLASTLSGSLTPGLPYPYPLVFKIQNVPDGLSATNFSVAVVTAAGDQPVDIEAYFGGQVLINLPANLASGPLTIKFTCNGAALAPVVLDVSAANPAILQASNSATGSVYTGSVPAYPGDLISILVTNLAGDIAPVDLNSLSVSVNGVAQTVYSLQLQTSGTNLYAVQFQLDPQTQLQDASGSLPLTITNGSRVSASFALPVAATVASTSN
jgi:hypothetical protein